MVKYTQTIRRQQPTNCFSGFDHFVKMVLKGLRDHHGISLRKLSEFKRNN